MVLDFNKKLAEALKDIAYTTECHTFVVHEHEKEWDKSDEEGFIERYGAAKWGIIEKLNAKYGDVLLRKADLYNWFYHIEEDEVAYFLSEAGSNCMNYSEFKAPYQFWLWLGEKGFIMGIEQRGRGFCAIEIDQKGMKENEGAAFEFYRRCSSLIFFDDARCAKTVYFEVKF